MKRAVACVVVYCASFAMWVVVSAVAAKDAGPLQLWSLDPERDKPPTERSHFAQYLDDAIDDGHVVLVVRDDVAGAFVLSKQQIDMDAAKVAWIFRKGLAGPLDSKNHACTTGGDWIYASEGPMKFGPFDVPWQMKHRHGRLGFSADGKTGFCVTTAKTFDGLDPTRSDWVYLKYPNDPGAVFAKDQSSVERRPRLRPVARDVVGPKTSESNSAVRNPLVTPSFPDGTVVLLTSGDRCAAVIFTEQRWDEVKPRQFVDHARYEWWLRRDGFGRLDPGDPSVDHGTGEVSNQQDINFGEFWLDWRAAAPGSGFLLYPTVHVHGERGDRFVCVTDCKALVGLDAQDPKWLYKRSADDPGSRFASPGK